MELAVLNKTGKDTGRKVTLSSEVFGVEPNDHAIYLDVKLFLANQRQGTHKSKDKSEITGSTRKIKKQKGTGTARAGSIKSGVFRGGGRFFGPQPRDYSFKLNKKVRALAKKSALTYKLKEEGVKVLEAIEYKAPKTKDFAALVKGLDVEGQKTLFILPGSNDNFYLSGRNIPKTKIVTIQDVNTYDVLNADKIIFLEESVKGLEDLLG